MAVGEIQTVFVGVDAGGTSTRAACINETGAVIGRGTAGPANHLSGSHESAREAISTAIVLALSQIRNPNIVIDTTFIASAGLEHAGQVEDGFRLLDERVVSRRVLLDTDAYAAWAGAFGGNPGIVVIAGTGSMALAVGQGGERVKVGGWGWRFGDAGSAYAIATQAIQHALRRLDGGGDADAEPLLQTLFSHIMGTPLDFVGVRTAPNVEAVRSWLYDSNRSPHDIASLAPSVEKMAGLGNGLARMLLDQAGADLAQLVAIAYTQMKPTDLPLAMAGSVLLRNRSVRAAFTARVAAISPDLRVVPAHDPPDLGAARLALGFARAQNESTNRTADLAFAEPTQP